MPRKPRRSVGDYLIWIAFLIWIFWILKQIMGWDPAQIENLLSALPWAAAVFGAGGFYEKVNGISQRLERVENDLKDLREKIANLQERVARIEGRLDA